MTNWKPWLMKNTISILYNPSLLNTSMYVHYLEKQETPQKLWRTNLTNCTHTWDDMYACHMYFIRIDALHGEACTTSKYVQDRKVPCVRYQYKAKDVGIKMWTFEDPYAQCMRRSQDQTFIWKYFNPIMCTKV